jgi:FkbM family methyltransferase
MSRLDRAIGLTRSLAIYYAIPFRQLRLRALYRRFVRPGDLVFDVGAHIGNRTRAFAALGCRVVAVEPQPHIARTLRRLVGRRPGVVVVEEAIGRAPGRVTLSISERTPTVSTVAREWRDERARETDFGGVEWNRAIDVPLTTLDALILRHGTPVFVKIDVEGGELAVLEGLSTPVTALSFEFLPQALDAADACVARLEALGPYRFNWSSAESSRLELTVWVDGAALMSTLRASGLTRHGDIYASLSAPGIYTARVPTPRG